jgi:hypothetical protein
VLSTIKLDDKPTLNGSKVRNEWADRHLASKLHAIQPTLAKQPPYGTLGIGRVAPE